MFDPREDCETLVNFLVSFAEMHLKKRGQLYPLAATMLFSGEVQPSMVMDEVSQPSAAEVLPTYRQILRDGARSGEYRATALMYDVLVVPPSTGVKTDALAIEVDQVQDYSVKLHLPYKLKRGLFGRVIEFGELFGGGGEGAIFA